MRKLLSFVAIAFIAVSGSNMIVENQNQNDTLKTRIVLDTLNAQPVKVEKVDSKIKLTFDKKSASPLEVKKSRIKKIVPGESNYAKNIRLAKQEQSRSNISYASSSIPAPVAPAFAGSFDELYKAAGSAYGIDWHILAAVHSVESGQSGDTAVSSYAGATGPMQFLPSTFRAYAVDGDGDGVASIYSVVDSVYSAANYISANYRVKGTIQGALYQYNHSWSYVDKVLGIAYSFGYRG